MPNKTEFLDQFAATAVGQTILGQPPSELTGLDFGRFTKSMMLAQGGFAAFPEASANDRAELLEELTGTEIYGDISRRVCERMRAEEQQLSLLKCCNPGLNSGKPGRHY